MEKLKNKIKERDKSQTDIKKLNDIYESLENIFERLEKLEVKK